MVRIKDMKQEVRLININIQLILIILSMSSLEFHASRPIDYTKGNKANMSPIAPKINLDIIKI